MAGWSKENTRECRNSLCLSSRGVSQFTKVYLRRCFCQHFAVEIMCEVVQSITVKKTKLESISAQNFKGFYLEGKETKTENFGAIFQSNFG